MKKSLFIGCALIGCAFVLHPLVSAGPVAPPGPAFAFDEGGKSFSKVFGQQVVFSGSCRWENAPVVLTGAINTTAIVRQGRWETMAFPLESFLRKPVEITATVRGPIGTPPTVAKLKFTIVNLLQEGAVGDEKTDDQAAIAKAIAKARSLENGVVYAPPGRVYAHSDVIDLEGSELLGGGDQTVFLATNPLRSAIAVKGDGARLRNLALISRVGSTTRQSNPTATMAWIYKATNFWLDRVTVRNGAGVGIFNFASSGSPDAPARITNCNVAGTLADGIHNTSGAHDIRVEGNTVSGTGDDMIAVVSYLPKPGQPTAVELTLCRDILITHNTVSENLWARGISVVGGHRVSIIENSIASTKASGVYIAAEDSYNTYGVEDVIVRGNRISKCPTEDKPAHSAILALGRESYPVSRIKIERNVIENSAASGIRLVRNVHDVAVSANQIKTTQLEGIVVIAATDTLIENNTIESTGMTGVKVQAEAQGYCHINGNALSSINTSGQSRVAAINVERGASPASIQITGNKHRSGSRTVLRLVQCDDPKAVMRGND